MPNLQDLRRRIRAVRNMQQVTRAMRMVSAARLRRAQERLLSARPYADKMAELLASLTERAPDYEHPLLKAHKSDVDLVVLITADKGLCGAFNSNLIRAAQAFIRERGNRRFELVAVGRKGRDFFRRRNYTIRAEYVGVTYGKVEFGQAQEIVSPLIAAYTEADQAIQRVTLIYNEFRSVASQRIVIHELLPLRAEARAGAVDAEAPKVLIEHLYEQPPSEILGSLLPRFIETQVYRALLESSASEPGARMMAMEAATNNAKEVIEVFTLNMNRFRQGFPTLTNV